MQVFKRKNFNQIWFTLRSDETLGVLDSGYLEDYFGNDGQVTLYSPSLETRIPIPMNEVVEQTPSITHDVFTGYIDLSTLNDGTYRIEGRVRDVVGNYTILSEIQTPTGNERVTLFEIRITDAEITVYFPTTVTTGMIFSVHLDSLPVLFDCSMEKSTSLDAKMSKVSVLPADIVKYVMLEPVILKGITVSTPIKKSEFMEASLDPDGN